MNKHLDHYQRRFPAIDIPRWILSFADLLMNVKTENVNGIRMELNRAVFDEDLIANCFLCTE